MPGSEPLEPGADLDSLTPATYCPFCDLIRLGRTKHTPNEFVRYFEPLNPVVPGHMLFVPDTHIEHSNAAFAWRAVGRCMSEAARWGTQRGEAFNLIVSSGHDATQSVGHIHVHYVPRRPDDRLLLPWSGQRAGHDHWVPILVSGEKVGVLREELAERLDQNDIIRFWTMKQP